jgi:hypothetical protein
MRRPLVILLSAVTVSACTGAHPGTGAAKGMPRGGCGVTRIAQGAGPRWARSAGPPPIHYAVSERGNAVGYLFGYPLVIAAHQKQENDKILWVVRLPRDGQPLRITGHRLGATRPALTMTVPDNSTPGEIYPSIVAAPLPGCWQFTLTWDGHTDTIDLPYADHR